MIMQHHAEHHWMWVTFVLVNLFPLLFSAVGAGAEERGKLKGLWRVALIWFNGGVS